MNEKRPALPALTGLRFFAALWVVFGHIFASFRPDLLPSGMIGTAAMRLAQRNSMAVSLFFLLSGFILAYGYSTATGGLRGPRRAFWLARFARIYPVYLLAWLLGWRFAAPLWPGFTHAQIGLLAVTGLQSWFPSASMAWDAPSWSLSDEAFFYLLFPALLPLIGRLRTRTTLLWLLAGCWLAFALPHALYDLLQPDHGMPHAVWLQVFWCNPVLRLPEFVAGVALGRLFLLRPLDMKQLLPWGRLAVAAAAIGLLLTSIVPLPNVQDGTLLVDPLWAVVLYGLACGRGTIAMWLARPALVVLGEASYALYLLHEPVWLWLSTTGVMPWLPGVAGALSCAAFLGTAIALSVLVWCYVETPARRAIRALSCPNSRAVQPISAG